MGVDWVVGVGATSEGVDVDRGVEGAEGRGVVEALGVSTTHILFWG